MSFVVLDKERDGHDIQKSDYKCLQSDFPCTKLATNNRFRYTICGSITNMRYMKNY